MKIIVLMPVRNEAWILPCTLRNISSFADHIIVADQMSTDGSRDIYMQFPKVRVINNTRSGHSNEVRWDLLTEARNIPGNNLILCIDADEMIPSHLIEKLIRIAQEKGPGYAFSLPWIQLWKQPSQYRVDGVWNHNFKQCAFYDNRILQYSPEYVINDHTNRIPPIPENRRIEIPDIPLIHLQFLAYERMQIKQAWYQINEYLTNTRSARSINYAYHVTSDGAHVKTLPTPHEWLTTITIPDHKTLSLIDSIKYTEITTLFKEKGVAFFEPLDIWHNPSLHAMFIESLAREPRPTRYPSWLITLNMLRRKLLSKNA